MSTGACRMQGYWIAPSERKVPWITSMLSSHPSPFRGRSAIRHSWESRRCGFSDANGFVVRTELGPLRLKLIAGFRLIRGASFQRGLRSAFEPAFSCDIEFRHAVRDRCERQRSKNNDREMRQHIRSPGKIEVRFWTEGNLSYTPRRYIDRHQAEWPRRNVIRWQNLIERKGQAGRER
jgi:hypothetical protein